MKPETLTAESFRLYGREGRGLAAENLQLFRSMPLSVLPSFLDQLRGYDAYFPREQELFVARLAWLAEREQGKQASLFAPFAAIRLSPELTGSDWVNDPRGFVNTLSSWLWRSGQIDSYHQAGSALFAAMPAAAPPAHPPLVIAVMGRDASNSTYPLFTQLRARGLYARKVAVEGVADAILETLAARSSALAAPYAHWYLDGGEPWPIPAETASRITAFTYPSLAPIHRAILDRMDQAVQQGTGPEVLQEQLSHLTPAQLGAARVTDDLKLQQFFVQLLTLGSGTQIYSTSFLQAAATELVRRAQPTTFCFRFAPRRRQASLNDLLEQRSLSAGTDPDGSLIDADMAAYYAYLRLAGLPGGEQASFVAWVESRGEALIIGPHVTRGVESTTPLTMRQALALATS